MRPWRPVYIVSMREGNVETIECDDELVSFPQLGEDINYAGLHASFPYEVFVSCSIEEVHAGLDISNRVAALSASSQCPELTRP